MWVRSFDKSDIIEKNKIRNQFFVKIFSLSFHMSVFEVIFIKTSNPALNLKVVHKWCSLIHPFPANYCLAVFYIRSFSCALYSNHSSKQASDEK